MSLLDKYIGRLRGQRAWILGGKRIGQTVARALAEQGVHIAMNYFHSRKEAEQVATQCRRLGVQALTTQCDAGDRESVTRAVRHLTQTFHQIDILINMASVFDPLKIEQIRSEDWRRNWESHVLGSFWPVQLLLPHLPRGAHMINIADRTSIGRVYKNYLPYVVTKGAVEHLTRALATELGPRGVIVNAIAPGPILPPDYISSTAWRRIRESSALKLPITNQEAVEQFALLVLYLSVVTLTSGWTYSLDQGQNL